MRGRRLIWVGGPSAGQRLSLGQMGRRLECGSAVIPLFGSAAWVGGGDQDVPSPFCRRLAWDRLGRRLLGDKDVSCPFGRG